MMNLEDKRILVTGGYGFFGKHLYTQLLKRKLKVDTVSRKEYDLREYEDCFHMMRDFSPDVIFHLAALVGGIGANQRFPADFLTENLQMGLNLLRVCTQEPGMKKIQKLIMVGSVCSYPKVPPSNPFLEEDLFNGYPEETNAPYGEAKRALLVAAQAYKKQYGLNTITLLPTNLYGPGDCFDTERCHVLPALIKRIYHAKENGINSIKLWGTGMATRCFLYVEDAANGLIEAAIHYDDDKPVNLASKNVISIFELANKIKEILDYKGEFIWDSSKPDGQPHRALDTSKAEKLFLFKAKTSLDEGLKKTIEWYLEARGE